MRQRIIVVILISLGMSLLWWAFSDRILPSTPAQSLEKQKEIFVGTEDVGDNLSLSPDGHWLFYRAGSSYILYNIEKRDHNNISMSDTEKGGRLFWGNGCWSADSTAVFLPSLDGNDLYYKVDTRGKRFTWEPMEQADPQTGQQYGYGRECPTRLPLTTHVNSIHRSSARLDMTDPSNPERILSIHRAGLSGGDIYLSNITESPNGKDVAYQLKGDRGGWDSLDRSYVLCDTPDANVRLQFLGESVSGPILWSPDGKEVYADMMQEGGSRSIYSWNVCQ